MPDFRTASNRLPRRGEQRSDQRAGQSSLQSGAVIAPDAPRVPDQDLGELARQHELKLSGARPSLAGYLAMLWQRRHFIIGYATARNISMYTEAKLGQIWQVLTPILNACVYYLIFGLLFEAARAWRTSRRSWWPACSSSRSPSGRS